MTIIEKLFQEGNIVYFKKGDILISPPTEPTEVFFITEGFIYSYSKTDSRKKRIQTILKKGNIFPLIWSLKSIQKDLYGEALSNGHALVLDREKFVNFVTNNHKAALEIIAILSETIGIYVDRLENLEFDNVRKKVLNRLVFFAERFGSGNGKKRILMLPLTHQLIAESISVSRENVTRELKALEIKKIIAFNKRQIIINDINKLRDELSEDDILKKP